jgi:hypothetical protein
MADKSGQQISLTSVRKSDDASQNPFEDGLPDVASRLVRHSLPEFPTTGRRRKFQTTGRSREDDDEDEDDCENAWQGVTANR